MEVLTKAQSQEFVEVIFVMHICRCDSNIKFWGSIVVLSRELSTENITCSTNINIVVLDQGKPFLEAFCFLQ